MEFSYSTALVVTAVVSSLVLCLERGNRVFPLIALVVSGVQALIVFGVISFAMRGLRIDVVLPALLVIAGVVCWSRTSHKSHVTAATLVTLVGLLQLLAALRVFDR